MDKKTIDLTPLISNREDELIIDQMIDYDTEELKAIDVEEIKELNVVGKVRKDESESIVINLSVVGTMILLDSVSLEPVEYPISFEIEENLSESLEKIENTLDIYAFLWENIVLEVPLKFTKVEDLSEFHGDGWKLISEEENSLSNNPFSDLLKKFKEE